MPIKVPPGSTGAHQGASRVEVGPNRVPPRSKGATPGQTVAHHGATKSRKKRPKQGPTGAHQSASKVEGAQTGPSCCPPECHQGRRGPDTAKLRNTFKPVP